MKLCWLAEKAISWATDSDAVLPGWVERHLIRCASCRRYRHETTRLTNALVTEAEAESVEAPAFLRTRIIANLDLHTA